MQTDISSLQPHSKNICLLSVSQSVTLLEGCLKNKEGSTVLPIISFFCQWTSGHSMLKNKVGLMLLFSDASNFLILLTALDFQHDNLWFNFQWIDFSTTIDKLSEIGCIGHVWKFQGLGRKTCSWKLKARYVYSLMFSIIFSHGKLTVYTVLFKLVWTL